MSKKALALSSDSTVLIVDDNHQYGSVLQKILSHGFGFRNITFIDSVQQAYTAIKASPDSFQLLFIDFRFPSGETGGNLLERLSSEGLLEGKIAFLITSEPTPENVKQAVRAGALGVVAKPFDRNQLKAQIEKAQRFIAGQDIEGF